MGKDADPREVRYHRSLGAISADFLDGANVLNAQNISVVVPIAGEARWRCRLKCDHVGTLRAEYLRPASSAAATPDAYTTGNPADVAVLAGVEAKIEDLAPAGESLVKITFIPGANGAITYADFSHF